MHGFLYGVCGAEKGKLLEMAEAAGFDILITGDKTLQYEQNMQGRKIALISLSAVGWPLIEPHVPKIVTAVDGAMRGSFIRVECGKFSRAGKKPKG
jgi:hypothetical protein